MTKVLRDGYQPPGRPSRDEWNRMTFEERLALPEQREPIPTWALDPEFRRRQGREIAQRIEAEQGPEEAAAGRARLEEQIEADEVLWQQYLARKQHRATA